MPDGFVLAFEQNPQEEGKLASRVPALARPYSSIGLAGQCSRWILQALARVVSSLASSDWLVHSLRAGSLQCLQAGERARLGIAGSGRGGRKQALPGQPGLPAC